MEEVDKKLEENKARVIAHMNRDHFESLVAYARYYAEKADCYKAVMTDVSSTNLTIDVHTPRGVTSGVLVAFPSPLESADALRPTVMAMHYEAYEGLGLRFK